MSTQLQTFATSVEKNSKFSEGLTHLYLKTRETKRIKSSASKMKLLALIKRASLNFI